MLYGLFGDCMFKPLRCSASRLPWPRLISAGSGKPIRLAQPNCQKSAVVFCYYFIPEEEKRSVWKIFRMLIYIQQDGRICPARLWTLNRIYASFQPVPNLAFNFPSQLPIEQPVHFCWTHPINLSAVQSPQKFKAWKLAIFHVIIRQIGCPRSSCSRFIVRF